MKDEPAPLIETPREALARVAATLRRAIRYDAARRSPHPAPKDYDAMVEFLTDAHAIAEGALKEPA